MPLINQSNLPSYERLKSEGQTILDSGRAMTQEIRELHIGILNIMPDGALEATERQFLRLINSSTLIAQLHVHFFTLNSFPRDKDAKEHIDTHYETFETIKEQGLDALIITGTNDIEDDILEKPYWTEMHEIMDWAYENVTSTMYSCLATHVAMNYFHGIKHNRLSHKKTGLYEHSKADQSHPLMFGVNSNFHVPHSRNTELTKEQFESAGAHILVESEKGGVHIATSPDRFRFIYFQGHPEYDTYSLLKEYKRDLELYFEGKIKANPAIPKNYFSPQSLAILEEYKSAVKDGQTDKEFPEQLLMDRLTNTWRDSCRALMNNWIGHVYQVTNMDRKKAFMDGIDPNDPLGLGINDEKRKTA